MANFDIETARSKFPALKSDQVFFDSAGGSQTLGTVIQSISDYLIGTNVQLGATYKTGAAANDRFRLGQEAGAKYINAGVDEIVFGPSTTQLFRNISHALRLEAGDELVVSSIDHEANVAPWVDLAAREGLTLRWWTPSASTSTSTGPELLPEDLRPLLSDRTRLVAGFVAEWTLLTCSQTCTHASNILGTITDVAAISAVVRAAAPRALLCVDGVAYAPHRPVDVRALGVDLYSFSWYKVYGPHLAMLYASPRARDALRSLGHFFNPHETLSEKIPAVVEHLSARYAWPAIEWREAQLQGRLLSHLLFSRSGDVTVYGRPDADPDRRLPTVSFGVAGVGARAVVEAVERGTGGALGLRWGAFYSHRLVRELLGLDEEGVVRVSMVHYNTMDEVERFIEAFDKFVPRKN
ncbi:PLP-dependent transferase [Xylariaceae sp. FL0804]|nr:PLP-dependent transferase [Xylariaceae sp. FL0804]